MHKSKLLKMKIYTSKIPTTPGDKAAQISDGTIIVNAYFFSLEDKVIHFGATVKLCTLPNFLNYRLEIEFENIFHGQRLFIYPFTLYDLKDRKAKILQLQEKIIDNHILIVSIANANS
jgi:hypothetical protein